MDNSAKEEAMAGESTMGVVVNTVCIVKGKVGAKEGEVRGVRREGMYIQCNM